MDIAGHVAETLAAGKAFEFTNLEKTQINEFPL